MLLCLTCRNSLLDSHSLITRVNFTTKNYKAIDWETLLCHHFL
uniref:Uncharacterized protein n=1 Tax=Rhizophora mucronata TaxID=61149 RepID=A0A2P2IPG6_RHIMU